jgi:hypothetical protein
MKKEDPCVTPPALCRELISRTIFVVFFVVVLAHESSCCIPVVLSCLKSEYYVTSELAQPPEAVTLRISKYFYCQVAVQSPSVPQSSEVFDLASVMNACLVSYQQELLFMSSRSQEFL